ncbi:hypothetical protein TIFTF001_026500 [Ficus carica]|uniref:Histone-lysine N-methyltransferase, H3 lysine-9 specific SUVH4 n=1 Tax=Ficus carica TaxID=3494 RepID=A0AA88DLA0_FICCA|nr:hypothetical protein TIFTF001_026500 [Ficus carica]
MVVQSPKCVVPMANGGVSGDSPSLQSRNSSSPSASKTSSFQRRSSARIQYKKELLVRRRVELLDEERENGGAPAKKRATPSPAVAASGRRSSDNGDKEDKPVNLLPEVETKKPSDGVTTNLVEKSDHAKIKDTIRLFNKHYLHFVQEEEKRCKKAVVELDKKSSKASKSKMIENKENLYSVKRIGNIPGIDVGHQFYSRAEMVVVGFHSHWLNGIDYMGQNYSKGEYSKYTFPLAVAIVLSGMYEDDLDNAEDVVYTGQGGHNLTGDKRQIRDQVMERGNLALKNCVDQGVHVRVVRGHDSPNSYCGRVYTYDGLYKVVQYWAEKGISGFTVFKFRLKRLEGQPLLTTNQVQFIYGRVPQSISEIRGLVCDDITGGQENIPIPATNLVDDPPVAPTGKSIILSSTVLLFHFSNFLLYLLVSFTYYKSIQVAKNVKLPKNATGCDCIGTCGDPKTCSCAMLNGDDFPYVHRDGGRLIEAKDVVFECGAGCGCGPACVNRTSQRGLKYRFEVVLILQVFRTPKKGWAVRSWDFIPAGAPICEYTGILRKQEDVDTALGNDYIFDIDCLQTIKGLGGRERRSRDASKAAINSLDKHEDRCDSVPEFCIDAGSSGNIARFINHSCGPNLFVQCVLSSHHDMKLARVMLFAADNIPPLQELTYDYGYALDSVLGPDGKVKQMPCYCGAADCHHPSARVWIFPILTVYQEHH